MNAEELEACNVQANATYAAGVENEDAIYQVGITEEELPEGESADDIACRKKADRDLRTTSLDCKILVVLFKHKIGSAHSCRKHHTCS